MVVVLDNARDTAQVLPLLPGRGRCTVLVTSRNRLDGLVAGYGAYSLPLDVLGETDARKLLASRLGGKRLDAEPDAASELVSYCSGFPLALSIAAGRAHLYPDFPLSALTAQLRHTTSQSQTSNSDPTSNLSAVLSWSYDALTHDQAEVFRLLSVAPGPDSSVLAAAALTGLPINETLEPLLSLERVSLLQQQPPGRYRMHDLVRAYAADQAGRLSTQQDLRAALHRVVGFYLYTAFTGDRFLDPHRQAIDLPEATLVDHPITDQQSALAWFEAEHPCLLAAQQLALDQNWYSAAWKLAWAQQTYHQRRGNIHDLLTVWRTGLVAADHLDDAAIRALVHRYMGHAHTRAGQYEEALHHLRESLAWVEQANDPAGKIHTHRALSWVWGQRGDIRRALQHAVRSLDVFQHFDHPVWKARALNTVGWYSAQLNHNDRARTSCEAAVELFRHHGDPDGEAATLDSLGLIEYRAGDHESALRHYEQAVTLFRNMGNAYNEANSLEGLAQVHAALGAVDDARAAWEQAGELYRSQRRTDRAERIQQLLATPTGSRADDKPNPLREPPPAGRSLLRPQPTQLSP